MTKSKESDVASYESRWLEVWRDAAVRDIILKKDTEGDAIALRHRLYRLRLAMKRERHPYYDQAAKVKISNPKQMGQSDGSTKWVMVMKHADREHEDTLREAGFVVPEPPSLD